MKRNSILAVLVGVALALILVQVALAHERRIVGRYEFVVGFLNEPAYAGLPNGIDVRVTNTETNKPVDGIEKTVKISVFFGGKSMPVALATRFGQPGAYAGYFIPTKPGTYIFQFTGDIEGLKVDEKFESGPGRFNDVQDTAALQFPDKVPAPLEAAAQVQAARDAAANAQTFAYFSLAVGMLGVVFGVMAWRKK